MAKCLSLDQIPVWKDVRVNLEDTSHATKPCSAALACFGIQSSSYWFPGHLSLLFACEHLGLRWASLHASPSWCSLRFASFQSELSGSKGKCARALCSNPGSTQHPCPRLFRFYVSSLTCQQKCLLRFVRILFQEILTLKSHLLLSYLKSALCLLGLSKRSQNQ